MLQKARKILSFMKKHSLQSLPIGGAKPLVANGLQSCLEVFY